MYIVEIGIYGKVLVFDGKWQFCIGDEFLYYEFLVYLVMICYGFFGKVFVFGGGEGVIIWEVFCWKDVKKVVMVDIDGEVVEICC